MFKLINDIADVTKDAITIVTAPVRIVVNVAGQVVKPVAEALDEAADDLKDDK